MLARYWLETDIKARPGPSYLSNIVEWEPGEEDVGKELGHTEDSVHHPVGQPLGVVVFGGTFDGFNPTSRKETHIRQLWCTRSTSTPLFYTSLLFYFLLLSSSPLYFSLFLFLPS